LIEPILYTTAFSPIVKADALDYICLDLPIINAVLDKVDTNNAEVFSQYVKQYLSDHTANVAIGAYNESRNIYKQSKNFNASSRDERVIHSRLDLWTNSDTQFFLPLAGKIHSFRNNIGAGNYGPTITLKHNLAGPIFYTLYRQLTTASLEGSVVIQERSLLALAKPKN
jgi:hypothetical protein